MTMKKKWGRKKHW